VADEQDTFSRRPLSLGEEVAGAADSIHGDPARLEPQSAEFFGEDIADLAYAVEVQRAAVHVHDALEQGDGFVVVLVDVRRDPGLRRVERPRRDGRRGGLGLRWVVRRRRGRAGRLGGRSRA
jgi:hypothetical protein